ncbi:hypothetical protein EJ04DRAFT_584862 [Polyplosphaeria fusca]|uniref:Uncharacterized protein n=1 Tax=Polyplosphaeria fusca TaxID=682080 RepID=A0A9P4QSK7_9PLEO|nr:hypothetical protein EJ04DRAFT_584862 [Polyplosphaeria fusca]
MPRPKPISISRPFDARHVSGADVGVPGMLPIAAMPQSQPHQRSFTFEPSSSDEEKPTSKAVLAMRQSKSDLHDPPPKRSNSLARKLSRPSLRLRTSLSRLTLRSRSPSSISPDESLRKRGGEKDAPRRLTSSKDGLRDAYTSSSPERVSAILRKPRRPLPQTFPSSPLPPPPPPKSKSTLLVRPKRADSGTAIDFNEVPAEQRPLGFKEILAVRSFEERMELYARAREYWAAADHGLGRGGGGLWLGFEGREKV